MPTIKDVAKLAGVSTATVSRAMMNPEKVSEKTRLKVELAVAESGFSPNVIARNLRRSESKTIVVIVPDIANMFFASIVRGIQQVALNNGYKVLLGDSIHTVAQAKAYMDLVRSKQADGIISLTAELPMEIRQGTEIPMVMACEYFPGFPIPTVRIDNRGSAKRAVDYLLDIGHSRIGCITGPMENPICVDRKAGYQDGLQQVNIESDEAAFEDGDFSFQSGYSAFMRLYQHYAMTALFCFNDMMALGAMKAATQLGIKVPQDLSIVGFDDLLFAEYTNPELTTIRQPQEDIGKTAANTLMKILQGGKANQDTIVPTQLLVRASCTSPKK
ncbi:MULTISPECIES: LacI family DNA-binding transcriptional regulator [unclassified Agarivorans]|uniref:LacI family DNA-binding transcriptional regulator n=1 Tax=unclassified Agarivorans TaxID=2636026 RepID=UPI0026E41767|nr:MULTISPECIES: LacI family DNA-binding transcriptional regulator [unclassified Agarivorans]MDO6687938.1 LacI family DNA-binding transcriptional regulator [Agarivorans sp. 3_MG-2023]MDO6717560.1 LacI family DNA-binding transcriptional regulator [Agarivorans sp. 2_MG-2023]